LPNKEKEFILDELEELIRVIAYVSGTNENGEKIFCYLLVTPMNYAILKNIKDNIDVSELGEVLVGGKGDDLDNNTKKAFLDRFGIEFNFREKAKEIETEVIAEYKKFFEDN
jgi:hypothetical protein